MNRKHRVTYSVSVVRRFAHEQTAQVAVEVTNDALSCDTKYEHRTYEIEVLRKSKEEVAEVVGQILARKNNKE